MKFEDIKAGEWYAVIIHSDKPKKRQRILAHFLRYEFRDYYFWWMDTKSESHIDPENFYRTKIFKLTQKEMEIVVEMSI